jgi:dihydrofolate reductase
MGTICAHEFVSLDGVFEDPRWTAPFGYTEAMGATIAELTGSSDAILLGRRTFEMFAPAWSTRSAEDDPGATFFNDTTKHVVSATLDNADAWQNSEIIGAYDPDAIARLKADGNVYVSGSGTLVRALLADGLLDELHLFVFPVILGTGARLLPEGTPNATLALIAHETYDNGVLHLAYGPAS